MCVCARSCSAKTVCAILFLDSGQNGSGRTERDGTGCEKGSQTSQHPTPFVFYRDKRSLGSIWIDALADVYLSAERRRGTGIKMNLRSDHQHHHLIFVIPLPDISFCGAHNKKRLSVRWLHNLSSSSSFSSYRRRLSLASPPPPPSILSFFPSPSRASVLASSLPRWWLVAATIPPCKTLMSESGIANFEQ